MSVDFSFQNMTPSWLLFGYFYVLISVAKTLPTFQLQSTDLDQAEGICKDVAIATLLTDPSSNYDNFRLNVDKENDEVGFSDSLQNENVLTRTLIEKDRLKNIERNVERERMFKEFSTAFENCLKSFLSKSVSDQERVSGYTPENVDSKLVNSDLQSILSEENSGNAVKRTSSLALNPTGWRKRRSFPYEDERLRRFMRNMHELFEKRQRLEFNPTGW